MRVQAWLNTMAAILLAAGMSVNGQEPKKPSVPVKGDMTEKMEKLGNPHAKRYASGPRIYGRNVWVMREYKGKIYLGAGNSANEGPAQNCGPVPVIAFDPGTKEFVTEWEAPDEQIDVYRVFSDGNLYIPGHDPKEDWSLGNFYRKDKEGNWEKVRTMPKGVHNYDMAEFDKKIFCGGYGVAVSSNWGKTMILLDQDFKRGLIGRAYSFLPFQKGLFAVTKFALNGKEDRACVGLYNKSKNEFERVEMKASDVMPKTKGNGKECKIMRPTPYKKDILYIGGYIHNDHQTWPIGAYSATATGKGFNAKRITLPKDAMPWDFEVYKDKAYLLFSVPGNGDEVINHVWVATSSTSFKPLFSFRATTFARSFVYFDGFFYFGMGCEVKDPQKWDQSELKEECGEIYRIPFQV